MNQKIHPCKQALGVLYTIDIKHFFDLALLISLTICNSGEIKYIYNFMSEASEHLCQFTQIGPLQVIAPWIVNCYDTD